MAIEVHKIVEPGLLEFFYQDRMRIEREDAGIPLQTLAIAPAVYKGRMIRLGFQADILIADVVNPEINGLIR